MNGLVRVDNESDIFEKYMGTPIELLFRYHNFAQPFDKYVDAQLLIGMCMDNRKQLKIPNNFAYVLRSGGGNLRHSEFKISYAIAIGGVKCVAIIAHNKCGMVNLISKKDQFIRGMVENAGWDEKHAEEHFISFAPIFEIENELSFLMGEINRLRTIYPKILFAPLYYNLDNNFLYLVADDN